MRVRDACRVTTQIGLVISLSSAPALSAQRPSDHPRWAVLVLSEIQSRYIDEPICNSLEYFSFSGAPQRFDYDHELSEKNSAEIKDKVNTQPLGEALGYPVHEVDHIINGNELTIKMLLVMRKPGEFCEIYHQQLSPDMVTVKTAYLVHFGAESILASTDPYTENNSGVRQEIYWSFDKDGPIWLDVDSKIGETLKKLVPKGLIIMNRGGFDVRTLTYGEPVWKPRDPHCCPTGGSVEIKFALKDHQLVVVNQSYKEN